VWRDLHNNEKKIAANIAANRVPSGLALGDVTNDDEANKALEVPFFKSSSSWYYIFYQM
jgi:hypothetical protein